jgi:uncharacterized membrane protein (UPF0127 family)
VARSPLVLENATRGTTVAQRVEAGESFWARFRGLMGRRSLAPHDGLWLPHASSIHMLFMRFPIDCAFLSKPEPGGARRVVAVRRGLPAWRGVVWWARGADGVVELPVGALAGSGTEVGDLVTLRPL